MNVGLDVLAEKMLAAARRAGAESADAIAMTGKSIMIDVRGAELEQAERSEGANIGLRVFIGRRQACVSATDTGDTTVAELAERAVEMARHAPEDIYAGLAEPGQIAGKADANDLELADPSSEPMPECLKETALEAEAASLAVNGVSQVESAAAFWMSRSVHLAATNGFSDGYSVTESGIHCLAIAGEGTSMESDHDGDRRIFASDLRNADDIGRTAGERAVAMLGSRKPPTGAYPVLFDERVSGSLVGHLLSAANGDAVARGSSWLLDKIGERVLPNGLSIVENPRRTRVGGSRLFDAEGLPTCPREIVRNGILAGWTLDLATGRKLGMASTGNAYRGVSAPPRPANWNVELTQGDAGRDELVRKMGTGLLVTSMIGATINPNTGDYSRGASGFWVENGEIAHPISECTIAGNLADMLLRVIPANDARPWLAAVVPSLLVEGLTLAGN
ncbi:MAG: TldD/PmbA family protein [Roseovarius sp.]|nr:TldD/PmbA family protein [Roseovarius sp.]